MICSVKWIVLDDCLIGKNENLIVSDLLLEFCKKACTQKIERKSFLFGEIYSVQCDLRKIYLDYGL